jgi:hypothetical protein
MNDETYQILQLLAKKKNVSVGAIIRMACAEYTEKELKK